VDDAPIVIERPERRREWLYRALLEATLIVLGVLGGLAVNEWQAARDRRDRAAAAMTAIRSELQSNLEALREVHDYNRGVVQKLRELGKANATSIPPSVHPRGFMARPELVSVAWDSAQAQGVLIDVPMELVVKVGRGYESQRRFVDSTAHLLDMLYEFILQPREQALPRPGLFGDILNDYVGREGGVMRQYEEALAAIDGVK
jgi:hypothetical protein